MVAAAEPCFDEESVLEDARRATGLSDFGPDDFHEGLRVLLRTYSEGPLTERGRKSSRRRVVGLLATRLRVAEALRRHDEITQRELPHPMVLTGLPRSGTSALFNLLASDPSARALLLWETQFPDPLEDAEPGAPDPRRAAIEAHYAKSREQNPEFTKIHFASADTPEECVLLHAYSMTGVHLGTEVMIEPYASWYRDDDLHGMYAYYKTLLQMLDWQRPGERWLLKAPAHMWGIGALIDTFPDVSIVWSHRNPLACTASICSMTHTLMDGKIEFEKTALGPVVMDFYATSLERGLAVRDQRDPAQFVDVTHDEFVERPMAVAETIYGHFGLPLDGPARAALESHASANPKGRHGAHEYSLDDWGLTKEQVRARFAPYTERFGIETD
ncbi:MAG: sulfotransferase [Deltaproteobacteria bacterium]|nr:sulfotransferase [Deltaproteobacteria bacterium]